MRRFLASAWYPFLTAVILAGVTVAAFAMLSPTGEDVGNGNVVSAFKIVGWAIGPVMGVLALLKMIILNGIRRIVKLRKVAILDPIVVLCGTVPWFVFAWIITDEPRLTNFARAAIDFAARPMLWGGMVSTLFAIVCAIPLLFSSKK
jgi:hypothetical protein